MTEWPLIGRARELAYLRTLADEPGCRGVVLAAPAGVGKTRLARECLRAAGHAGMLTLVATASPAVAGVPLGAMASTLSAFGGVPDVSQQDPGAFLQDVVQHVVDRAGDRRVCLLIDDAHLLDHASAALVHQLSQRSEVFLVVTLRTRESAPDAITALWKDGILERIELDELDLAAVEDLLSAALDGPVDGGTLATLSSRSQGNLLFLREMVQAARDDGSLAVEHGLWRLIGDPAPPELLVELVEARLGRLTEPERHLLQLLAVGEPLGTHPLQALSSMEVAERLEDTGLIISRNDGQRLEVRLAHPVYGEVLRSRLSGLHTRRLARSLAEAFETTGLQRQDDALRVASWRLISGGGKPEQLLSAAVGARWRHDLSLAYRLASAAAGAGAGFEADLLTAQLLLRLQRPAEADAEFARLCSDPDEGHRVRATLARVDIAQARNQPEEMHRLLAELDPPPADPALRAAVIARSCIATLMLRGPRAALVEATVPEFDEAVGDAVFALHGARAVCFTRLGRHTMVDQELEKMDIGSPNSTRLGWWRIPHSSVLSQHLISVGRLHECSDMLEAQYSRAVTLGSAEMQMATAYSLGRCQLERGRLRTAAKLMHEAIALAEQLDYAFLTVEAMRVVALAEALGNRTEEARTAKIASDARESGRAYSRGLAGHVAAWLAVADGDLHGAYEEFLATAAFCRDSGDLVYASSSLHGLVRIGRAADAVDGLTEMVSETEGPWTPLFLRHAEAVVLGDGAALEDVARGFEAVGAVLLAAETLADAAAAWSRAGEPRHATAAGNRATELADRCEGARTPSLQEVRHRKLLTSAEYETARRAAAGESNRAIAQALQLSVRTVETRLQLVYKKLGVSRRTDLAEALPDESPSDARPR